MRFGKVLSFCLVCLLATSCAAIFKGSRSKLDLASKPTGAKVYIDGNYQGDTPLKLRLESKRDYTIEFRMEGYPNKTVNILNKVGAGWIILDVLCGLAGIVVDSFTGSWYEFDQRSVTVVLEETGFQPLPEGSQRAPKAFVRKGAEVVVTLIQGSRRGELVGVEADGLVIVTDGMDSPWSQLHPDNRFTLAFSDIKSVRIINKMKKMNVGLLGALVGIPMGVVAAKVSGVEASDMNDAIGKGSLFLLGGMVAGAVTGILLADPLAKDETYVLQGKSKEEIEKILVQLKKRARIENDQ